MSWLYWVVVIVLNLALGVAAGLGVAAYLFQRKYIRKDMRELREDVDNLYVFHGYKPPSMVRFERDYPEIAALYDQASEDFGPGPPEEQIP